MTLLERLQVGLAHRPPFHGATIELPGAVHRQPGRRVLDYQPLHPVHVGLALAEVRWVPREDPRSRGLTVPAIFFAWGNCIPRGIEAQCVTDEQVMGLDPIALLALLLA